MPEIIKNLKTMFSEARLFDGRSRCEQGET